MEELIKSIHTVQADLNINLEANLKGNKAAGLRARKATLELEKLFKQYRKLSVEASK